MYPILIIVPSLNRPQAVGECIQSFTLNSTCGYADYLVVERRTEPGMQAALNSIAKGLLAQYEIIGIINDDVRMRTKGWDKIVYDKLKGRTGLVYGRDGIQDRKLATQPFFSAHVAVDIGLLGPPAPYRNLNDRFWCAVFHAIHRIEFIPELFTEHLHPSIGKRPVDATYLGNMKTYLRDKAAWPLFLKTELPKLVAKIKVV